MNDQIDAVSAAAWLKAFSNRARLEIAFCLLQGERSVREIENELKIRQPNLSQHLAELRNAQLAVSRREFKSVYYSLAGKEARRFVRGLFDSFTGAEPKAEIGAAQKPSSTRHDQAAVFAKLHV
ncbi:MAG: metalloregulator ArsR/SmtB family transcription factor [Cyanobacteria bacterium P01_E01_bin.48]